jgi:hypothetical protein
MGHFEDMLKERGIAPEWAERAMATPDITEDHDDGTRHFIKRIPEFGNRWLRVIVNVAGTPEKTVTVFFDRRLRRQHENKGG